MAGGSWKEKALK